MSRNILLLSLLFASLISTYQTKAFANTNNDLVTVNYVDVGRYLGAWYRISSYPLFLKVIALVLAKSSPLERMEKLMFIILVIVTV